MQLFEIKSAVILEKVFNGANKFRFPIQKPRQFPYNRTVNFSLMIQNIKKE